MKPLVPAAAVAGLLFWAGAAWLAPRADAQTPSPPDSRFAGLEWTFARIRYTSWTVPRSGYLNPEDEPWFIDAPAAEQNLSRRVRPSPRSRSTIRSSSRSRIRNLWSVPVDLHCRTWEPAPEGCGSAHPARVPAARRDADVRRFPRADRVGQSRERAAPRLSRPEDRRPSA